MARVGTKTSDFGVSKREGHDASRFYGSKLYDGIQIDEKSKIVDNSKDIDDSVFGKVFHFNDENIERLPDYSIHLVLYPVLKFDKKRIEDINGYLEGIKSVVTRIKKKLVIGGRLIMIVDNEVDTQVSRFRYWPFHAYIAPMIMEHGLYMRGEVILKHLTPRQDDQGSGCVNGPKSAYIHGLIFSNTIPNRERRGKRSSVEKTDTISRDQFLEYTKSVWNVNTEVIQNKQKEERLNFERLDYYSRFIHLYSFYEDTILSINNENDESIQNQLDLLRKRNILFILPK